jgi:hypothetical protein
MKLYPLPLVQTLLTVVLLQGLRCPSASAQSTPIQRIDPVRHLNLIHTDPLHIELLHTDPPHADPPHTGPVHAVSVETGEIEQPTQSPQVIKIKLNDLSGVSEWIRVEITGNQVKPLHTVVAQSGLSRAISAVTSLRFPVGHTWYDHPTQRIFFKPDDCEQMHCLVTGTDVITLPSGTDPYQGEFTMEYLESGWLRTIQFKIPAPKLGASADQPSVDPQPQVTVRWDPKERFLSLHLNSSVIPPCNGRFAKNGPGHFHSLQG